MSEYILSVRNLKVYFPIRRGLFGKVVGHIKAVDDISFSVKKKSIYAIIGESGSGKTTVLKTILRLYKPTSGRIIFNDVDVTDIQEKKLMWYRRRVQAVFQNPYTSLNPRMRVKDIIAEPLKLHTNISKEEIANEVAKLAKLVGLPENILHQTPTSLSGGQAQRVAIARAISTKPDLVLLDEPTSALDVSMQAQILNLLLDLREKLDLTYVIVTHDISIVRYMADYISVMYLGKIVEEGSSEEILSNPLHPYTKMLLISFLDPLKEKIDEEIPIEIGEPPSIVNPPTGCRFHTRCPLAKDICKIREPPLIEVNKDHRVACWLYSSP
ncbi:MAG: ABC transporter ATP-binding protein [Sulfolobales archaeon]